MGIEEAKEFLAEESLKEPRKQYYTVLYRADNGKIGHLEFHQVKERAGWISVGYSDTPNPDPKLVKRLQEKGLPIL